MKPEELIIGQYYWDKSLSRLCIYLGKSTDDIKTTRYYFRYLKSIYCGHEHGWVEWVLKHMTDKIPPKELAKLL